MSAIRRVWFRWVERADWTAHHVFGLAAPRLCGYYDRLLTIEPDHLAAVEALSTELRSMPGVSSLAVLEPNIVHLKVTLAAFDSATWDRIVWRCDDFAREHIDDFSLDLSLTLASASP